MKIKDRVIMTEKIKADMIANDCKDHIDEFGDQEGTIVGYPFEGDIETVDVKWDSGLKYMYDIKHLIKI